MILHRDGDIRQATIEAEATHAVALRSAGICTHGATQGYSEQYRPDLAPDRIECLCCGERWESFEAYYAARRWLLG
jgi:hypothetical protein